MKAAREDPIARAIIFSANRIDEGPSTSAAEFGCAGPHTPASHPAPDPEKQTRSRPTRLHVAIGVSLTLLLWVLIGCKPDPIREFMQGTWYYNDEHLQGITSESELEAFWTFAGDAYESESCCFGGETYERGNYRILRGDDATYVLELQRRTGHIAGLSLEEGSLYEVQMSIDQENDTLKIGRAVYTRWQEP